MNTVQQFIDVQVNGTHGADFNNLNTSPEQIEHACRELQAMGVEKILAAVITEHQTVMERLLSNIAAARGQSTVVADVIAGVHIEGPFINEKEGYVGAHKVNAVRLAHVQDMQRLLAAAEGLTRIVTLAPERDPGMKVTRFLADQGIIVSAGHCDPSFEQLKQGVDAGLRMFTHLGNGCPRELHRHDNIVQRVLATRELTISFIADGVHIPYFALKNYLETAGLDRSIIITDAMSAAGLGPGEYTLGDQPVVVDDRGVTRLKSDQDPTHFAASAATMPMILENTQEPLGLSDLEMQQLMYDNPKTLLGV